MARLPSRPSVTARQAPPSEVEVPRRVGGAAEGESRSAAYSPGAGTRAGQAGPHGDRRVPSPEEEVGLDAAIDAMLVAGGVDAITRVRLSEARRAIVETGAERDPDGFDGANLSRALFRFVMPRLRHPDVLRADRHRALLEGLADGLAGTPDDGIAQAGALVIHRELRRLALLRTARNALVEG
ncbi:hypothetical protein [Methylobacterium sp. ARG-1]|uniref:hypothetical protein n=1 Tax=Methylobacterium sp. ARG-1 TaxID=1692501 RepID=UPI00068193EB|nr:hypothetical protein [Methylobacterium sp. ARG-1]